MDIVDTTTTVLTKLCVDTLTWKELSPTNPDTGPTPTMKHLCGMIPVKIDGKYYLLAIGGQGPSLNMTLLSIATKE